MSSYIALNSPSLRWFRKRRAVLPEHHEVNADIAARVVAPLKPSAWS